jgi:hypothetical protein
LRAPANPGSDDCWKDSNESALEDQLTEILIGMLISTEAFYCNGLIGHREWII